MQIPSSFALLGQRWTVCFVEDLSEQHDCVGDAQYRKNLIRLQANNGVVKRPQSQVEQTFLHELVHTILEALGEKELNDNEKLVDLMAGLLHQAFTSAEYADGTRQ